jgi:nucleotide-binding universal stress UspA family protein
MLRRVVERVGHVVAGGRRRLRRHARRTLAGRHRTIVVPLLGFEESRRALDLACRLAADRGAHVLLLGPLFVDAELPLDAHMHAEERAIRDELARERALAESYGVAVRSRVVRARRGQLGAAVAEAADEQRATLVVLGALNVARHGFRRPFTRDVWSILGDAPCRVMVVTERQRPVKQLSSVA